MPNVASRLRLTKGLVDKLLRAPKDGILRDAEIPGFAARRQGCAVTFIVDKRTNGRLKRVTIGPYGPLTVTQARERAREIIGQIIRGEDPTRERHAMTFGDLCGAYLERHATPRKQSVRDDKSMLANQLKGWANRRLTSIRREDVDELHREVGREHPYRANRLLAMLRKMFSLAKIWGFVDGDNPATGIERFKEHKRDRFLSPQEMPRFFVALRDEPNVFVRAAILTTLLLGLRRGEALSLRWSDLDLDEGLVRIAKTKADRPHLLPLPQPVIDLLRGLPRLHDNEHVFPGRHGKGHLVNVGKNWRRIRAQAGLEDVRIHDLRRTLGSWLVGRGASLPLIGRVLNHTQASTTQVYARLDVDGVRRALEENAHTMLKLEHGAPLIQSTEEGHA